MSKCDVISPSRPDLDLPRIGRLLRRIESIHDLAGWNHNAHATLYLIYDPDASDLTPHINRIMKRSGDRIVTAGYGAQPMLAPRHFATTAQKGVQASEAIRTFALNIAFADPDLIDDADLTDPLHLFRGMLQESAVLGFAAASEAYGMTIKPGSDTRGISWRTQPNARSKRFVVMVDTEDRMHMVTREQGGHPAQTHLDMREPSGYLVDSLRILADLSTDRLPTDQAGFNARYDREDQ